MGARQATHPGARPPPKGGRPAEDDRQVLAAILSVLRTAIQRNALPRELGACTTVSDRFRRWEQQGVFAPIWQAGLQEYDAREGLAWQGQSMDGGMTQAPFGGAATGANPTDRGKRRTKRSQLRDARGRPLVVGVDGATRTDMKVAEATLDSLLIARPTPTPEQPHQVCLDAGYDYDAVYETVRAHHDEPHSRPNLHNRVQVTPPPEPEQETSSKLEATKQPRRWVVERLHSWLNRSRRVVVRWEKFACTDTAFLHPQPSCTWLVA